MDNILEVKSLKVEISSSAGLVRPVKGVDFTLKKSEVLGIIGKSGSGKTLTALSILKLLPKNAMLSGSVIFDGKDIFKMDGNALCAIRGSKIAMVFQEPASALNPVFTVGDQIVEAYLAHNKAGKKAAKGLAIEYMERMRIAHPERVFGEYPHALSGGMNQRVMIAMAMINSPKVLILDEPTSALDTFTEAKILDLIEEVIEKYKLSAVLISHDLDTIKRMCRKTATMDKGKLL